jgi:TonB-dependent starch-binding outer membrane protein SusC
MKMNLFLKKMCCFRRVCAFLLILLSVQAYAGQSRLGSQTQAEVQQQKKLSGIVTDNAGKPIPGVAVSVKGTTNGVSTDVDGRYSFNSVPSNAVLVFSFVGMKTVEVKVGTQESINVTLADDIVGIGEVVAIGYGTQQKRDVTGATSSVKAMELVKRPILRLEQALQGTTPGVFVVSSNGKPGSGLDVKVRGTSSITGGTSPLYVIDGYIGGDLESLNPNDIASMEILKDASSTAIYGSRGSNGVVLITTKGGQEGKPVISFDSWFSNSKLPNGIDLMTAAEFAQTVNTRMNAQTFSQAQIDKLKASGGTNWFNELTQSPWVQNYNLSIAGGTSVVKYRVSYNRLDAPGTIINTSFLKSSVRANLDVKASNRLNLKFNFSYDEPKNHNNNFGGGNQDPFGSALTYDPTMPVRNEVGQWNLSSQFANNGLNPVAKQYESTSDSFRGRVSGTGVLDYKIMDGLTFTSNNTYSNSYTYDQNFNSGVTTDTHQSSASASTSRDIYWQNSNYLTFDKSFGDHHFTVTALYEQSKSENVNFGANATNLTTTALGYWNLTLGSTQTVSHTDGVGYGANQMQSYMGRIFYSYKNRYLLTASMRRDGSSRLTKKYDNFPSAAIAWNLTEENFLKDHPVISSLKARVSYGETGNQAIGNYSSIQKITLGTDRYFFDGTTATNGTFLGSVVAKGLVWEHAKQTDVGIDAALYGGRLTFTFDYYNKDNDDLLYSYAAPLYVGGGNYNRNMGKLNNQGFEFSLGGKPIQKTDFSWSTNFTISFNKNKVVSLGDLDNIPAGGDGFFSDTYRLRVGHPLGEMYGFKFLGTWKTSEKAEAAKYGANPGDSKYADLKPDGVINNDDRTIIGNGSPKYSFGFINDFKYKAFSLNVMLQGVGGNDILSQTMAQCWGGHGMSRDATIKGALNMWTPTHETDIPSIVGYSAKVSDRWVYDGSYIRLKNIALTYNLPKSLISKVSISNMDVYVSGQNLLTITNYPGFDPETSTSGDTRTQGLDQGALPNPRTFTVGFRIDF